MARRVSKVAVALERSLEILSEQAESREPWELRETLARNKAGEMKVATRTKVFVPNVWLAV